METMNPEAIGKRLQELRGERTRLEVADKLGISQSALAMYESGQRIPRDNIKIRLADFYNTPIYELFFLG